MNSLGPTGSRSFALVFLALAGFYVAGAEKFLHAQEQSNSAATGDRQAHGTKLSNAEKKTDEVKDPEVIDGTRYLALVKERRGKPLMVSFWATWCEPCRDEYPMVVDLARQYGEKRLSVIGVSLDEDAEAGLMRRFLARAVPGFPNYRKKPGNEEAFINRVNPKWSGALPATFFYSREGQLVTQIVGEAKRETFEAAIQKVIQTQ
ncbi:MAG: TlpA family protein disulfide reductase [Acidipila sp.]|nr:TlpA family protein disulfide reductase [Acidipila sp.]